MEVYATNYSESLFVHSALSFTTLSVLLHVFAQESKGVRVKTLWEDWAPNCLQKVPTKKKRYMGLSENRVHSQWNSHLIGIMISKTIGYNGVHDIFRHTHIATNMLPNDSKWYVWNISGQIPLHRVFKCPAPREDHPTRAYTEAELVNWWVNATIHWIHGSTLCILKQSWILKGFKSVSFMIYTS